MIRAIKKFFGIGSDFRSGIKIVVNKEKLETRVALVENGMLEEYTIERSDSDNVVGSIFKGKVRNLEPGLKAMFVDLGFEKTPSSTTGTPSRRPWTRSWKRSSAAASPRANRRSPARTFRPSTRSAPK
jgi:hypothetical protein